jgi:DNA (cytosine-5)-methyltransferase 1
MRQPLFIVIDLFCGFGGTTRGYDLAELDGEGIAHVFACVNHDPKAIKSHWLNHPKVKHFEEDIRTLDLTPLVALTRQMRDRHPDAKLVLWASLECTNFSKAKGGLPRNADSRTLADHLPRYIRALEPDYIKIENVVEFMSWGPLDEKGKPLSRRNGEDWLRWRAGIDQMGYRNDWRELNSANFGAYTSRNRLFGIFAKDGLPIVWPEPTHAKNPSIGMHGGLKKWMPVKDVLNFEDEGESILNRATPLVDPTLERIYAGLVKFVAKGDTSFLSKYYSGTPSGMNLPTYGPAGSVTTKDHHSVVQADFLVKYNSRGKDGGYNPPSTDDPAPVISTQNRLYLAQAAILTQRNTGNPEAKIVDVDGPDRTLTATGGNQDLVRAEFLSSYYGNGGNTGVGDPCPTLSTHDRFALIQPERFIEKQFGKSQNSSVEDPAGTVMPNDKHRLVTAEPFIMPTNYDNRPKSIEQPAPTVTANRKYHYLINPQWGGHAQSVENPSPVIIARQDKAPLYLVYVIGGLVAVEVYEGDSPVMIRIKQFMAAYGIVNIKMRMLRVPELLRIQGFPADYKMVGNQSDQKKFIGNSVVPHVVKAWAEAIGQRLLEQNQKVA